MRLAEYLRENGITQEEFGRCAKLPQQTVSRVARGGDTSGKNWARIELATDGQVRSWTLLSPRERAWITRRARAA